MRKTAPPLLAVLLLSVAAASAQDAPDLRAEVDRLAKPYIEADVVVGMSVGIVRGGERWTFGYGRLSADAEGAPDGDTVYEIGSITKVFTGTLLADLVERKKARLDEPVRALLPEGTVVPKYGDREITLLDLATHTSGLPRMPDNFAPKDPKNPYADYTEARLFEFLATAKLLFEPGTRHLYSNLGVGLLGQAIARRAGKTYGELLSERIIAPLGMASTSIDLPESMARRLAPGHDAELNPAANWDIRGLTGAGAIRSTAKDMLTFLAAHFEPTPAMRRAMEIHWGGEGKGPRMGLCWTAGRVPGSRWHNGGTGGYHSMAVVVPEKELAVVVLANTSVGMVDGLAWRIIRLLLGEKVEPQTIKRPVPVDPKILETYVGTYRITPEVAFEVTRNRDRLYLEPTGQPRVRIYPESETEFFFRVANARVVFEKSDEGKVTRLIFHQGGRATPAVREE